MRRGTRPTDLGPPELGRTAPSLPNDPRARRNAAAGASALRTAVGLRRSQVSKIGEGVPLTLPIANQRILELEAFVNRLLLVLQDATLVQRTP